jgi:hypothetical protein
LARNGDACGLAVIPWSRLARLDKQEIENVVGGKTCAWILVACVKGRQWDVPHDIVEGVWIRALAPLADMSGKL